MPKVILERNGCIGCGACAAVCPSLFKMAVDGLADLKNGKKKKNGDFELPIEKVEKLVTAAVKSCPVNVIKVKK